MQIKVFNIPAICPDLEVDAVNKFMSSRKVLSIDKQFYMLDGCPYWAFCIEFLPSSYGASGIEKHDKIDYKGILTEEEFSRFSLMRKVRKQLADKDAVPAYAVFTDAELADMSRMDQVDLPAISKIKGIGVKRVEKFGVIFCDEYRKSLSYEASEQSVG